MFTIVASSTTMSWARPTVPRISHRRGSGPAPARAAGPAGTAPALVSLITLHLSGAVISCGAGPAGGHRPVPRASGLVAGRSISRDVFLAASLRAARLVINADLSNNS